MSEIRLNLIDSHQIIHGTIHGSVADSAIAALSAEPETVQDLEAALARYIKPLDDGSPFSLFTVGKVNQVPWDAGIVIIDLAARVVAAESTYSSPHFTGEVYYHDGHQCTDISIPYRVPEDWKFVHSLTEYDCLSRVRREERAAAGFLDTRTVLYGRPLLEFIATQCEAIDISPTHLSQNPISEPDLNSQVDQLEGDTLDIPFRAGLKKTSVCVPTSELMAQTSACEPYLEEDPFHKAHTTRISAIHARWLTTPREDLRGQSPRDVILEKQDFIDYDLHTRSLQWSMMGEGPPTISRESHAYKYAGFGTHEWVVYYDLVRHLLWKALELRRDNTDTSGNGQKRAIGPSLSPTSAMPERIALLETIKNEWLEQPQQDYEGKTPANIIDNERRRMPEAMSPSELIIDEDCEICRMQAQEAAMGYGPGFWHLDGSQMDDGFAFASERTREEWEAENRRREEFNKEFSRRWDERQERIARGEVVTDDFSLDWVKTSADYAD